MKSLLLLLPVVSLLAQTAADATNPTSLLRVGLNQKEALRIRESLYQAIGFGNTFLITTGEGNVIVDTSLAAIAPRHQKLLRAVSSGPIRAIILTHGHGDHTGGVAGWRQPETQVIAQKNHAEFLHYQKRLEGFFALRNAAQFGLPRPATGPWPGNFGAKIEANVLFDQKHELNVGGLRFELYHTPGETPDHLTVWVPEWKAAFVGDNFYDSFPNMYTLRGTQPRWALEYIASLNKVLALKPEILLPSHGPAILGNDEITRRVTKYRNAIQYVHDEVVKGMNSGRNVFTLMREVRLPKDLDVGESYGKLSWSVRGIYEGYAGYFDTNPSTMYDLPPNVAYADLVKLAGGPDAVAKLAVEKIQESKPVEALHLTDAALAADPRHRGALEARARALGVLIDLCRNTNERGWLDWALREVRSALVK